MSTIIDTPQALVTDFRIDADKGNILMLFRKRGIEVDGKAPPEQRLVVFDAVRMTLQAAARHCADLAAELKSAGVALAMMLLALPALGAEPPATIDLSADMREIDGSVMRDEQARPEGSKPQDDPRCLKCPTLTPARAIMWSLNATFRDEIDLPLGQKRARSILGDKVRDNAGHAQLSADEIAVIKKCLGKLYPGQVLKQVIPLLDPNDAVEKVHP